MMFPSASSPRVVGRVLLLAAGLATAAFAAPDEPDQQTQELATRLVQTAAAPPALTVHLGCGDGRLAAALHRAGGQIVHGLASDADQVQQTRQRLQQLGLYGPVSVERWEGNRLPYGDNLVNLLVVSGSPPIGRDELLRVLCPGGAAILLNPDTTPDVLDKITKPRPAEIDEWTHFLHDASGNPVAHDAVVGPPGSLQWSDGPRYMRSHEHTPGMYALVSAGGRIFYIVDEAPIASVRRVPEWQLLARDAFNGVPLWKKPVANWFPHLVNWGQTPPQLERRLVSVGDRVYVTLGWHAPLAALDAATGETLHVYEQTEGAEEVLCHQGVLLLVVRSVTEQRLAEQEKWARMIRRGEGALEDRDAAEPLVKQLRAADARGDLSVVALEAESGRVLWRKTGPDVAGLRPLSLCADAGQVFCQTTDGIVCLDLQTGQQQWSTPSGRLYLARDGVVLCADGKAATVLSAETGDRRWQQPHLLTEVRDVFLTGGSVWVGGFKPFPEKRGPSWGPYFASQLDLQTGRLLRHIEADNPSHHHRCYQNKATDRFILGGRRGTEFIDLETGDVLWNSWARGVCRYGVMPCNGLLYVPPHACGCYMAAKLIGFNALAPRRQMASATPGDAAEMEPGPALATPPDTAASPSSDDWPTYRHDPQRSGCSASAVPATLAARWRAQVGGRLTPPTVAGGRVFAVSADQQRICALDADSGQPVWQYTAGARVDSPPTIHQGRAVFGGRDGFVYSLRASDGTLAWRRRVAREDRRVVIGGQLESVSPVPGSVLVQDGVVYCTAGRSSYLDGGIDLCRIEPGTGTLLSRTAIYSPDPETGQQPPQSGPADVPGAREDILSSDAGHVYLRDMVFGRDGQPQAEGSPHLFAMTAFLDDAWAHRAYWVYGTQCSVATGCSSRDKNLIYGRLFAVGTKTVYGYGRTSVHWSNHLQDGPYRLFAVDGAAGPRRWEQPLPIQVRALVLAGDVLFAAGPPVGSSLGPWDSGDGQPSLLVSISAGDGSVLAQTELPGTPVFDGLAAAGGRLICCLEDGSIVCLE